MLFLTTSTSRLDKSVFRYVCCMTDKDSIDLESCGSIIRMARCIKGKQAHFNS